MKNFLIALIAFVGLSVLAASVTQGPRWPFFSAGARGLVAHYQFAEFTNASGQIVDSSTNSNEGYPEGALSWRATENTISPHLFTGTGSFTSKVSQAKNSIMAWARTNETERYKLFSVCNTTQYVDDAAEAWNNILWSTSGNKIIWTTNVSVHIDECRVYTTDETANLYTLLWGHWTNMGQGTFEADNKDLWSNTFLVATCETNGAYLMNTAKTTSGDWTLGIGGRAPTFNSEDLDGDGISNGYYNTFSDYTTNYNQGWMNNTQGAFSMWFRVDDTNASMVLGSVSGFGVPKDDELVFSYRGDADQQIQVVLTVNNATVWLATSAVGWVPDTNVWHNVVCTSDGSTFKVYLDAVFTSLTDNIGSNSGYWWGSATDADIFTLPGLWRNADIVTGFDGDYDEVRFFDAGLTPAQVTNLYQAYTNIFGRN